MAQMISIKPAENGTAVVTIIPTDEDGTALTLGQLHAPQWQLQKTDGTIVNSRTFASCAITSLTWVLKGDDLALSGSQDSGIRVLGFQATYDSDIGSNLPLNYECQFEIEPLLSQVDAG